MNKPIKIILIIAAVILAIGAVLIFMKTVVSPPQDLRFNNQYEIQLKHDLDSFRQGETANLESDFTKLADRCHRFKDEAVIEDKVFDEQYNGIIGAYVPKFSQYCFTQFQKSVWKESELKWMEGRISQLRALTLEDGSRRIMDNYRESDEQFAKILSIIGKYREAKALSYKTSYAGLEEAISRISKANQFKKDEYLRNNASLVYALNILPSRLESSHYASLRAKVKSLANYYNHSEKSYDAMSYNVLKAMTEYENNASSVYGKVRNTDDLRTEASRYDKQANEYFSNQNK